MKRYLKIINNIIIQKRIDELLSIIKKMHGETNMKKNDPISNIATKNVVSVQEGQKISDIRHAMRDNEIHHVPVVNGKRLVGMVSFTDMMKLDLMSNSGNERSIDAILDHQFSISDVMTSDLKTLDSKSTVRDVAEILSVNSFHSVPLVDADNNLVGVVTSTDLIKYLCSQY